MTQEKTTRLHVSLAVRLIRAAMVRYIAAALFIASITFMTLLLGFDVRQSHTIPKYDSLRALVAGISAPPPPPAAVVRRRCTWNVTETASSSSSSATPWPSILSSVSIEVGGGRERLMFSTLPAPSARFGNQLFGHASLLGIAYCTGYRPVVYKDSQMGSMIPNVFSLTTRVVDSVNKSRPISNWTELQPNKFTPPEEMNRPGWLS